MKETVYVTLTNHGTNHGAVFNVGEGGAGCTSVDDKEAHDHPNEAKGTLPSRGA